MAQNGGPVPIKLSSYVNATKVGGEGIVGLGGTTRGRPRTLAPRTTHTRPICPAHAQYVPTTSNTSLIVGVRVRPLLNSEQSKGNRKDIIRVIDSKVVVVLDPDESKVCAAAWGPCPRPCARPAPPQAPQAPTGGTGQRAGPCSSPARRSAAPAAPGEAHRSSPHVPPGPRPAPARRTT